MDETVKQGTTATEQERTFTQAEMDAIIGERLRREREKYANYEDFKAKAEKFDAAEEAAKTDLQKATELAESYKAKFEAYEKEINTRNAREKVANEKGIPANLLTGETEEECIKQADNILAWRGTQSKYPNIKDSGEVIKTAGGKTRDQFSDWFNEKLNK